MRGRESNGELLWWLVDMAHRDRAHYRVIREALWALYAEGSAERSRCSDKPSKLS